MQSLYLGYTKRFDPESSTWCFSGIDIAGDGFGVGSGRTMAECEGRLRDWILEVLESHADDGEDHFGDLHTEPPKGDHVVFDPVELMPIRLKLARARAGLRQSDMAARLGITQQAYAKLERPGANPTLRTIYQTELVLGADLLVVNSGTTAGKRKKRIRRSVPA